MNQNAKSKQTAVSWGGDSIYNLTHDFYFPGASPASS